MTAAFQYRQSVLQQQDEKFRSIVEELSSEDETKSEVKSEVKSEAKRLAAASKMGTFIKKGSRWPLIVIKSGGEYFDDAVDILINRVSVELDYNVLNAIIGSLEKVEKIDKERHKKIIDDLLAINRNIFIQDYALQTWKDGAEKIVGSTEFPGIIENEFIKRERLFNMYRLQADSVMLDGLKGKMQLVWKDYYKREKNYTELTRQKQAVTDVISVFLSRKRRADKEEDKERKERKALKLNFYQNSLNTAIISDIDLSKSDIKKSAFSSSTIQNTLFNESTISDTIFTFSDLSESSFAECTITASLFDRVTSLKKVSFLGATLNDVFL